MNTNWADIPPFRPVSTACHPEVQLLPAICLEAVRCSIEREKPVYISLVVISVTERPRTASAASSWDFVSSGFIAVICILRAELSNFRASSS